MNVLMIVNDVDDVENLSRLKRYLDAVEEFQMTVLYISDAQEGLCFETEHERHYILPDAELAYRDELENRISREFLHWLDRVHFRHEVGRPLNIVRRVMAEEHIDVLAVRRRQYEEHGFANLGIKQVLFEHDDSALPLAK